MPIPMTHITLCERVSLAQQITSKVDRAEIWDISLSLSLW